MSVTPASPPNPAATMSRERAQTTFDVASMNLFLEGGDARAAALIQDTLVQLERDPIFKTGPEYYDLTTQQHRSNTARKIARFAQYLEVDIRTKNPDATKTRLDMLAVLDPQTLSRIQIYIVLFLNCIKGNGLEAQYRYWCEQLQATLMRNVYGCFAMTELTHGSNVAGLETTATLDFDTNEFVINTPHVGATKWWIGMAAHTATHAVVYARLVVKKKDYGVKTFVVPLRDANHDLMPGVAVGDCGAKLGRHGIDNGWIQFLNVRIPREFMLAKYVAVSEAGLVTDSPLNQLAYAPLINGRVQMVMDSFRVGARFVTIALRYAVIRKQFGTAADGQEKQLLDYPLHQQRLMPYLAATYVTSAAAHRLRAYQDEVLGQLAQTSPETMAPAIAAMKHLFVVSASLKATCTWQTASLIDECRQACGGYGYSAYTGFASGHADWVVQCTWEGDNNVLGMSAAKSIIQALKKGTKGHPDLAFLADTSLAGSEALLLPLTTGVASTSQLRSLVRALQAAVVRAGHLCLSALASGDDWDLLGLVLVSITKVFAHAYALSVFVDTIPAALHTPLAALAEVHALTVVVNQAALFMEHGIITATNYKQLTRRIASLNRLLRPQVVGLTDAFKMSDFLLNSAIATRSGDIYDSFYEVVKRQNPPANHKASYLNVVEDMLNRPDLAVRERGERSEQVLRILRGEGQA